MAALNVRASLYISLTGAIMSFGQRALRLLHHGERFVWQERSALIVPVDKETLESSARLSAQPLRSAAVRELIFVRRRPTTSVGSWERK